MAASRTGWRLAVGAVAATVAVATGAGTALAGTATAADAPAPPGASAADVTVGGAPGNRLPDDFVGLSYEMRELGTGGFETRAGGNLVNLFRGLGRSNIRIAGNTLDRDTLWVPRGQQPPQPLPS